jgi:hypothetical protein
VKQKPAATATAPCVPSRTYNVRCVKQRVKLKARIRVILMCFIRVGIIQYIVESHLLGAQRLPSAPELAVRVERRLVLAIRAQLGNTISTPIRCSFIPS